MKKKKWFIQEYLCIDFESPDRYIIIIEVEDDIPLTSLVVKIPKIYPQFPINPYIVN